MFEYAMTESLTAEELAVSLSGRKFAKLDAIRLVRARTKLGLAEAKRLVERALDERNQLLPSPDDTDIVSLQKEIARLKAELNCAVSMRNCYERQNDFLSVAFNAVAPEAYERTRNYINQT